MKNINVTDILRRLGVGIIQDLKRGMQAQRGVDGNQYKPLAPKTVKEKHKISSATAFLRMIRTKDFQNHAFESSATDNRLTVKVSDDAHGRDIRSMRETIKKHTLNPTKKSPAQLLKTGARLKDSLDAAATHKEIAEWQNGPKSKFFPTTVEEINSLPAVQRAIPEIAREARRQIEENLNAYIQQLNRRNGGH